MSKKYVLVIVCVLLVVKAFSQNYYEDSFNDLKDDKYYPLIDKYLGNGDYDSVVNLAEPAFDYYFERGETDRAIYLFNVCMYFPTAMGFSDITMPAMLNKVRFLESKTDTLNMHYATTLHILAFGYKYYNEIEESVPYFERAIAIYEKTETPALHLSSIYQSFAPIYVYSGDFWTGYQMYQKALDIYNSDTSSYESFVWKKKHDIATVEMGIALAMEETGQDEFSYFFNKKAFEIFCEYYPESVNTVVTAINISAACNRMGNYKEADYYANKADSILKADYSTDEMFMVYYYILSESGTARSKLGDFDSAEAKFRELIQLTEEYYQGDNESMASPFVKLAENYYDRNEPDSALLYYRKAIELNPENVNYQIDIAKVLKAVNNYPEAIAYLQNVLNSISNNNNERVLSIAVPCAKNISHNETGFEATALLTGYFFELAKSENNPEYLQLAVNYSLLADTLILKHIETTISGADDQTIAGKYHDFAGVAIDASYLAWTKTGDAKYLNNILGFISQSTSVKLNSETNTNELTEKQLSLYKQTREVQNDLFVAENSGDKDLSLAKKEELFKLNLQSFELSHELQQNKTLMYKEEINSHPDIAHTGKLLNDDEAILAYHYSDTKLFCLFISRNDQDLVVTGIDDEFFSVVSDFYKEIKIADRQFPFTSARLYDYLIKPLAAKLGDIEKLVIIPDRELNQIPFEALVTENKSEERFLIEKFEVSYNFSISIWARNKEKSADFGANKNYNFLALAPVFGEKNTDISDTNPLAYDSGLRSNYSDIMDASGLKPLPKSEQEVNEIARLFKNKKLKSKVFTYEDASERNLKANISEFSILHFATHGYSSSTNPELSGLFLYKEDKEYDEGTDIPVTDDGFLFAGEIYNLDLNADLVVLSACKSGSGKIVQGEGTLALPRAFAFNGVPNIVASLWKIHDAKTKNLMIDFYKNILDGKSYSQALRLAKLQQIKNGELPLDWAGIVLIGL